MIVLVALLVVALVVFAGGLAAWSALRSLGSPAPDRTRPLARLPGWGELAVLEPSPGMTIRDRRRAYVRPEVAAALGRGAAAAAARGATLAVLDASLEGGGPFPPHLSHQRGVDVDVRYLASPTFEAVVAAINPAKLYVSRDRVASYVAAGLPAAFWPGHTTHAHLRF